MCDPGSGAELMDEDLLLSSSGYPRFISGGFSGLILILDSSVKEPGVPEMMESTQSVSSPTKERVLPRM